MKLIVEKKYLQRRTSDMSEVLPGYNTILLCHFLTIPPYYAVHYSSRNSRARFKDTASVVMIS